MEKKTTQLDKIIADSINSYDKLIDGIIKIITHQKDEIIKLKKEVEDLKNRIDNENR